MPNSPETLDELNSDNFDNPVDNETKADRFRRLGIPRVSAVLDRIRILGNLSNRSLYEYTDEQIDKIENAVRNEFESVIKEFRASSQPKRRTFDL